MFSTLLLLIFHFQTSIRKGKWYDFSLLNLLRRVLCPAMWSILQSALCVQNSVVYSVVGWNGLCTSLGTTWSNGWFQSSVSLLIFCLDDLSIADRIVLKSRINCVLSVSPFSSVTICLICLAALLLSACVYFQLLIPFLFDSFCIPLWICDFPPSCTSDFLVFIFCESTQVFFALWSSRDLTENILKMQQSILPW